MLVTGVTYSGWHKVGMRGPRGMVIEMFTECGTGRSSASATMANRERVDGSRTTTAHGIWRKSRRETDARDSLGCSLM